MATYVLVHGAWHGAWCWDRVTPILERRGHNVVAPDLPGHGQDHTALKDLSLEAYVERITDVLDRQPEPVILVGHSLGGTVISEAAERRPDKVTVLVYLAAFLLQDGQSRHDVRKGEPPSFVQQHVIVDREGGWCRIPEHAVRPAFCADCSDDDVAAVASRLVAEPLAWLVTPVHLTDERFGSVRRIYIECLRDAAIPPALQRKMYTALEVRHP